MDRLHLPAPEQKDLIMTTIALVAHDQKKDALVAWARAHEHLLSPHILFATGTTGGRLAAET